MSHDAQGKTDFICCKKFDSNLIFICIAYLRSFMFFWHKTELHKVIFRATLIELNFCPIAPVNVSGIEENATFEKNCSGKDPLISIAIAMWIAVIASVFFLYLYWRHIHLKPRYYFIYFIWFYIHIKKNSSHIKMFQHLHINPIFQFPCFIPT